MLFIPVIKAECTASLLQSLVSHDLQILRCWFPAQESFVIINVEKSCAASYYYHYYFSWFFNEKKVQKNIIYLK